jgi:hypothetical protein
MPTTGSERGSFVADGERDGPGGHIGLLRSPSPQRNDRVQSWLHAAMARGDKVATVAVPADLDTGGRADESSGIEDAINLDELPVLTPAELRREARQARLVERALAEGYRGLSVLIWADAVIAAVSPQGHAAIETSLAELCREHPLPGGLHRRDPRQDSGREGGQPPIYVALALTADGHRDILGLWAGEGGEGAKYWLHVLTEIKNRGVNDVLMVVCDGLAGLPDAVTATCSATITQTCVVHLLRNSFRYAGRQHFDQVAKALRPIYTAPTEAAAMERFLEFAEIWGERYPAIVRLWENAWAEFVPFLNFDTEIRQVVCSTDEIVNPRRAADLRDSRGR